jgi:hypothetical protein
MNPVAPTTPVSPVGAGLGGPAAAAPGALITNLPPGLANLTAGAILNGSVVGRDAQGHVLIQTPNGMLSLATALALPQGSTLSLQIQTTGALIQMVVLSINQQPQQPGPQNLATLALPPQPHGAPRATTQIPAPPAEGPAVTVAAGRVLTAVIVEQAPPGAAGTATVFAAPTAPGSGAQIPGAQIPGAQILGGQIPSTVPHDAQPFLAALLGRPQREGEAALPQKGTRLTVRIAALDTDPASDPETVLRAAGADRAGGRLLPGIVAEPDANGLVQVKTPIGLLSLSAKIPLPPASQVVLEMVGEPEFPPPPAAAPAPALSQGRGWPALEQALAVLAKAAPGDRHAADAVVPRAGPEMAEALIAAVAAIKTGDVRALVGDHILRALDQAGHHELSVRLSAEFRQLSSLVPDPAGGDWRSFLVPVHDGTHLQFVRFFLRRHKKNGGAEADSESTTRFVVEVDLSRMGAVQLDGLVKPKKFDLIIRSRAAIDPMARREISKIFTDALAASGHTGGLTFQASPHFAKLPARGGAAAVGLSV